MEVVPQALDFFPGHRGSLRREGEGPRGHPAARSVEVDTRRGELNWYSRTIRLLEGQPANLRGPRLEKLRRCAASSSCRASNCRNSASGRSTWAHSSSNCWKQPTSTCASSTGSRSRPLRATSRRSSISSSLRTASCTTCRSMRRSMGSATWATAFRFPTRPAPASTTCAAPGRRRRRRAPRSREFPIPPRRTFWMRLRPSLPLVPPGQSHVLRHQPWGTRN